MKEKESLQHILIVDDEECVALALQKILKRLTNCQIAVAIGGEQALRLFERQHFDLLITDYHMPDVDGITLARHVRRLCPQMAIIMITGSASDALREQAIHVPIQRILDKPVRLAEIHSAALGALDGQERRAGQQPREKS